MKLLFCINKDIHSYQFLKTLSEKTAIDNSSVFFTTGVGRKKDKNAALDYLNFLEAKLPAMLENSQQDYCYFKQLEARYALKMRDVSSLSRSALTTAIANENPGLVLSVRFGKIFKQEMINIPEYGIINVHSGLLPEFRGILATFWAKKFQAPSYGYTIHCIEDEGIDTGAILHRQEFRNAPEESLLESIHQLYPHAAQTLAEILHQLECGNPLQATTQCGKANYYSKPSQEETIEALEKFPIVNEDAASRLIFGK
jgi:methionyl-tRNA formyltransferase